MNENLAIITRSIADTCLLLAGCYAILTHLPFLLSILLVFSYVYLVCVTEPLYEYYDEE